MLPTRSGRVVFGFLAGALFFFSPVRAEEAFSPPEEAASAGFERIVVEDQNYGYVDKGSVWRFASGEEKKIFVCWEDLDDQFSEERGWVVAAVGRTWQQESGLEFKGWRECAERNAGIRIRVSDTPILHGPHVKALGRHLDGMVDGMVLNFTFQHWSKPRCSGSQRQSCIESIAVHEFGHAIGLAHEQNRPDAPGECQILRQGSDGDLLLTPYDEESVMNYCNDRYNNDGKLSPGDVASVRALYCPPDDAGCAQEI